MKKNTNNNNAFNYDKILKRHTNTYFCKLDDMLE